MISEVKDLCVYTVFSQFVWLFEERIKLIFWGEIFDVMASYR